MQIVREFFGYFFRLCFDRFLNGKRKKNGKISIRRRQSNRHWRELWVCWRMEIQKYGEISVFHLDLNSVIVSRQHLIEWMVSIWQKSFIYFSSFSPFVRSLDVVDRMRNGRSGQNKSNVATMSIHCVCDSISVRLNTFFDCSTKFPEHFVFVCLHFFFLCLSTSTERLFFSPYLFSLRSFKVIFFFILFCWLCGSFRRPNDVRFCLDISKVALSIVNMLAVVIRVAFQFATRENFHWSHRRLNDFFFLVRCCSHIDKVSNDDNHCNRIEWTKSTTHKSNHSIKMHFCLAFAFVSHSPSKRNETGVRCFFLFSFIFRLFISFRKG